MIEILAVAASLTDFDAAVAHVRKTVAQTRAAQVKARDGELAAKIGALDSDLRWIGQHADQLGRDLSMLRPRLLRYQPSRPNDDPALRYDVQRLANDARNMIRDLRQRGDDLRWIYGSAEKDPGLETPANDLVRDSMALGRSLDSYKFELDGVIWEMRRGGFGVEAGDFDFAARDSETVCREIQNDAQALYVKVSGN